MISGATLSADGVYRYDLTRRWGEGSSVLWIMLNPSTADGTEDDPTIRRCIDFSKRWGADGLTVVNLFALRATDPKELLTHPDPIGPENTDFIERHMRAASGIVAAWGATRKPQGPPLADYARAEVDRRPHGFGGLVCLGKTKDGSPRHPLYVKATTRLEFWP